MIGQQGTSTAQTAAEAVVVAVEVPYWSDESLSDIVHKCLGSDIVHMCLGSAVIHESDILHMVMSPVCVCSRSLRGMEGGRMKYR